ncbi:Predicted GTPases (ISS), related [Neospora caninum Liverpool]|uniref:Predicted GTPases (ISS), related n=1 Tax=Neospora caninum (strain Liverpool) TaxID=572307 RepID=F0VGP7_NEOCL|nr:Predicted GTPases (ISS), related [Neospora caninum Liverpool]CBZ52891.1 Predicted GTPases (ISS), related [Neospora caninum Liverpool]|eukprot:XP_003882923.1 Predicted GTPases (ISS), related [Neospora caninum Liverpool]
MSFRSVPATTAGSANWNFEGRPLVWLFTQKHSSSLPASLGTPLLPLVLPRFSLLRSSLSSSHSFLSGVSAAPSAARSLLTPDLGRRSYTQGHSVEGEVDRRQRPSETRRSKGEQEDLHAPYRHRTERQDQNGELGVDDVVPWTGSADALPPGFVEDAFQEIHHAPRRCPGCGAELQTEDPSRQGFVSAEKKEEWYSGRWKSLPKAKGVEVDSVPDGVEVITVKSPRFRKRTRLLLCRRCYRIQMYKQLDGQWEAAANAQDALLPSLEPETVVNAIVKTMKKDSVVLKLVDVCDLESSVVPELFQACRSKRLHVIWLINRIDCLPRTAQKREVKEWVRRMVRQIDNVHIDDCILVSSATGEGFEDLERRLEHLLVPAPGGVSAVEGRRIYVVGRVNAGKSTFVTRFLKFINYKHAGTIFMKRASGGVTRSAMPGTTLSFLPFGLPKDFKLIDTPGIPSRHQVTSLLRFAADLYSIVPSKRLQPITYAVTEGKSLLIGAMARIDLAQGSTALITCYFSHKITLHICKTVKAADLLSRKACTFLYPPHLPAGFDRLQPLVRHSVKVHAGNSTAYDDISIAGLGWISVAGAAGPKELHVWAPQGVKIFRRPAMLPLQIRTTGVEDFHGKSPRARGPRINAKKKRMVEALRDQEKRDRLHAALAAREREAAEARACLAPVSSEETLDECAIHSSAGVASFRSSIDGGALDENPPKRAGEGTDFSPLQCRAEKDATACTDFSPLENHSGLVARGKKQEIESLLTEEASASSFASSRWGTEAVLDHRGASPFSFSERTREAKDAAGTKVYTEVDEGLGRNENTEVAGAVVDLRPPEEDRRRSHSVR